MTTLRRPSRSTLAEKVARELERMIVSGEWSEGTKIPPEPELVAELGVSRNTVREAVRALTHVGLLEARPGDGTYVRSTSLLGASLARRLESCTLLESLEARHCLEREVARLAAGRRDAEDVEALRVGHGELRQAFEAGEPVDRLVERAYEQRLRLARASHNPLLVELYENISESVRQLTAATLAALDESHVDPSPMGDLHHRLVEAVADGRPEEAAAIVTEQTELLRSWLKLAEET